MLAVLDANVLALAVHYEADVIVTHNTKDFPPAILRALGLERVRPPTFVERLWHLNEDLVLEAADLHRCSLTKSRLSPADYLQSLRDSARLKSLAARLEGKGFLPQRQFPVGFP